MMNKGQTMLEAVDERGEVGFLDLTAQPAGAAATNENLVAIRLGDGANIFIHSDRLTEIAPDKYRYAGSFEELRRQSNQTPQTASQPNAERRNSAAQDLAAIDARTGEGGEIVVPLVAEEIKIGRKTVETGGVRVHKTVREDVQRIDEPIIREHLEVERVEVNQFVETAPAVRYEGDVMIVPVLEEVVVTQKRLLLREEIRLVKRREEIANVQEITLRREEISLENIETDNTETGAPER